MNRSQVSFARASEPLKSGMMSSSAPASWYRATMAATSAGVPAITGRRGRPSRLSFSHYSSVDRNTTAWVET